MPVTRSKKEAIVAALKEKIARARALVFVHFKSLPVAKASLLRRKMRAENSEYQVAKKSLLSIALRESGRELPEKLKGEVAFILGYGEDLAPFRQAVEFAKKEKDSFSLLGGSFPASSGAFDWVDADTARRLGLIPSREALVSQLMGVLQGNIRKFIYLVDQIQKSRRVEVGTPTS